MKVHEWLTEEKWTKGAMARDVDGGVAAAVAERAVCWCATGAILKTYGPGRLYTIRNYPAETMRLRLQRHVFKKYERSKGLIEWNDAPERTFDEVLTAFKELDM